MTVPICNLSGPNWQAPHSHSREAFESLVCLLLLYSCALAFFVASKRMHEKHAVGLSN